MRAQCLQTIEKAPFGGALKTERGGVYVALGFSGAQAEEKQFRPSGNRPENPGIFRFPQISSSAMKIRRFSWSVSKNFDTQGRGGVYVALGFSRAQAEEKQFLPSGNCPEKSLDLAGDFL